MTKASGTAEEQRAIAYLQWTGWLQDHDRQIYEQGKRDGIDERKTGRWEFVSYGDGLGNYHCSECRAIASSYFVGNLVNRHWEYKLTKYCGGCGAKMEGAEE